MPLTQAAVRAVYDFDAPATEGLAGQLGFRVRNNKGGKVELLFENPVSETTWITLRLVGGKANRFGVGARISVQVATGEEHRTVHRVAGSGGTFGGSSMQQEIGLGRADRIEEIVIRWPGSGTEQRFSEVEPNRIYLVREDRGLETIALPRLELGSQKPTTHHPSAQQGSPDS